MNGLTPDEEIEALLGHLLPAAPDETLMARLRAAEPKPENVISIFHRLRWMIPAAAAAVLAIVFSLGRQPPAKPPVVAEVAIEPEATAPPVKSPLESRQHLMDVTDLGVVNEGSRQPVRLIQTTWLDEIFYETQPGSAPVKEARVRQEVLPVAVSTF